MYHTVNEDAPQWATDTANVIKALTPAATTVRGIVSRPKQGRQVVNVQTPSATPSSSMGGLNTKTLIIGAVAIAALYFIFKKR